MTGKLSSIPKNYFPWIDVRDAADAHLAALEKGKDGSRYALVENTYFYPQIGEILYDEFSQMGHSVTTGQMCLATIWLASFYTSEVKYFYDTWGYKCTVLNDKIVDELEIEFITLKKSLIDMGYSLMEHGIVKDLRGKSDFDKNSERGEPDDTAYKTAERIIEKRAKMAAEIKVEKKVEKSVEVAVEKTAEDSKVDEEETMPIGIWGL